MRTYVKPCRHGTFLLLHHDVVSEYANLFGEWCEAELTLCSRFLHPNSRVVEVGANIGLHTVPLARMCPAGKVLAFEPQRVIYQILNANLALNNLLNVQARQEAVGASPGSLRLPSPTYDIPWNYGGFSIEVGFNSQLKYQGPVMEESVPMQSLDASPDLAEWPDMALLKVDVEGAERQVLRGAENVIGKHRPVILIENNRPQHGDALIADLKALDYDCYWFVVRRARRQNQNRALWDVEGSETNMVCLPRGRDLPSDLPLKPATNYSELNSSITIYE